MQDRSPRNPINWVICEPSESVSNRFFAGMGEVKLLIC